MSKMYPAPTPMLRLTGSSCFKLAVMSWARVFGGGRSRLSYEFITFALFRSSSPVLIVVIENPTDSTWDKVLGEFWYHFRVNGLILMNFRRQTVKTFREI